MEFSSNKTENMKENLEELSFNELDIKEKLH